MRDGRDKEVISVSSASTRVASVKAQERERWSGATVLDVEGEMSGNRQVGTGQMHGEEVVFVQVNAGATPVCEGEGERERETPTGLTPSDDFKTWETWAQR